MRTASMSRRASGSRMAARYRENRRNRTGYRFWVSGLASPFVTFGERAAEFLEAVALGEAGKIQGVMNAAFGELYAPGGGEAPAWAEVAKLRAPYRYGDLPTGVITITSGVDVQKNRLIYVVRGWGARGTSWLLE